MMPLWRESPDTTAVIASAAKTRAELLAFIAELDSFVATLNREIDDLEDQEVEPDA